MADAMHDLLVIGAGPGGYVAAIRAAQLGLSVGIIEKEKSLGGTCLRVGCIPSKALLESSQKYHEIKNDFAAHGIHPGDVMLDLQAMLKRKSSIVSDLGKGIVALLKKNKITRYSGNGRIAAVGQVLVESGEGSDAIPVTTKNILIATGSQSSSLPGIEIDGDRVGTSTEALNYNDVPGHLVVIGAGVIGLELGSVWLRLGAKVTVLEYCDHVLPGMDREIGKEAQKLLKRQGFDFRLASKVTAARAAGDAAIVEIDGAEPIYCDRVLVAVGRKPFTENLGLETVGVELDTGGRIVVNEKFATSAAGIFAIGDVIPGAMLAHKAEEEGVACVEMIAGGYGHVDYNTIPGVVYTHPEIAGVGQTEEQLKEAAIPYAKGVFSYRGNGRARTLGSVDGKAKILAHADTDRILGVHIIGERAGDLIAEAVTAMTFHASSEDLARTCHAHPSLSEIIKEAALAVDKRAIHA